MNIDEYKYTEREMDFIYCIAVFNTSGVDGLKKELDRLKELGVQPHDIIKSLRIQNEH
jgi:antirestriction protein ArdC